VALETLRSNQAAIAAAQSITHVPSALAARCERGVLQKFGERLDCYSSVAVHATMEGREVNIRAFFSDYEATRFVRASGRGADPDAVVAQVYDDLVKAGAEELVCANR
jgi:porphobilinogen deaminase